MSETSDQQQMMAAMFASLVMQNTNMALIFLGRTPHPQTGKTEMDLEHAQYFIDQLEMLVVKTKGNLDKNEDAILKQSLTSLRLAFVEAASKAPAGETPPTDEQETASAKAAPDGETAGEAAQIVPEGGQGTEAKEAAPEESKKKFTKKY